MEPVWIYGLAFKCPFEDEDTSCPFFPIRSLNDLKLQYEAIEQLSEDEKQEMLSIHFECKLIHQNRLNVFRMHG